MLIHSYAGFLVFFDIILQCSVISMFLGFFYKYGNEESYENFEEVLATVSGVARNQQKGGHGAQGGATFPRKGRH